MRIGVVTAALLLPSVAAGAEGQPSVIYQKFQADQTISQSMEFEDDDVWYVPYSPSPGNAQAPYLVQQSGFNAANLVSSDSDIRTVEQVFAGQQRIDNQIISGALDRLTRISQDGSNSVNIVDGTTIELAIQVMDPSGSQLINNHIAVGGNLAGVTQTGINSANMATAIHAIGIGEQKFFEGTEQFVVNHLDLAAKSTVLDYIEQSGTNIGNVLKADRIDSVVRVFEGEQVVENTVILNDGYRPRIVQSGNNIANLIIANEVGSVHQISVGTQRVRNLVLGSNGEEISHPNFDQSEINYMGSSNVINMMVIGQSSSNNGDMTISQDASFDQNASGGSGQSQTGNMLSINR